MVDPAKAIVTTVVMMKVALPSRVGSADRVSQTLTRPTIPCHWAGWTTQKVPRSPSGLSVGIGQQAEVMAPLEGDIQLRERPSADGHPDCPTGFSPQGKSSVSLQCSVVLVKREHRNSTTRGLAIPLGLHGQQQLFFESVEDGESCSLSGSMI